MAQFEDKFFEGEYRDGFYVESSMKHAWAAQVEMLEDIGRVCEKHGIRYFADSGTLLGAVRHQGFIPWDDDVDIIMFREDFEEFIKVAKDELPEGYVVGEARTHPDWILEVSRILSGVEIGYGNEDYLKKFHGCPYIVGIDIFVLDRLPEKKEDEVLQCQLLLLLRTLREEIKKMSVITDEAEQTIAQMERLLGVKIDREGVIANQCLQISDRICRMYEKDGSDEITYFYWLLGHMDYRLKKEWYNETLWIPFESIKIPVPVDYDKVLNVLYGADYMIPKKIVSSHGYPFYKSQEEMWMKHQAKGVAEIVLNISEEKADKVECLKQTEICSVFRFTNWQDDYIIFVAKPEKKLLEEEMVSVLNELNMEGIVCYSDNEMRYEVLKIKGSAL